MGHTCPCSWLTLDSAFRGYSCPCSGDPICWGLDLSWPHTGPVTHLLSSSSSSSPSTATCPHTQCLRPWHRHHQCCPEMACSPCRHSRNVYWVNEQGESCPDQRQQCLSTHLCLPLPVRDGCRLFWTGLETELGARGQSQPKMVEGDR